MKLAAALLIGLLVAGSRAAVSAEAPEPAPDGEMNELGLTPDDYAASLDYDTAYDDAVAQAYDDGYSEDAHQSFRDTLAPYGTWIDDPAYGQVWVPASSVVGQDFSPYVTNGDWVDTEYGWTWVSGWAWGWAPFHYGRWTTIAGHGWGWVPGTIWGPAWVAWRAGSGCVGWAPLPPRGVALGSPLGAHSPWRFVGASSFGRSHGAYLPPSAVPRVFGQMSVVSNARRLGAGRAAVTVNVGPSLRGRAGEGPGTVRLATVAPSALPRIAVQPRAGARIESRPWVQAGVTEQLAFAPMTPTRRNVVRGEAVAGALGVLGRSAHPSYPAPARGSAFAPLPRRSASFARPAAAVPAPAAMPSYRGSAPRFTAPTAPFTAPTAPFTAPTAPFTAPTTGFTGSSPSWGGARSGVGGGGGPGRSFGGGHPRFGGGGRRR